MTAAAPARPVELLGFVGQVDADEPLDVIARRRARLESAIDLVVERVRFLELENDLSLKVWRAASAVIPDLFVTAVPLPYWITFDSAMRTLDALVSELVSTVEWVRRIPVWLETGIAHFEESATVPGDLDLFIDPDSVPEAPRALDATPIPGAESVAVQGIISRVVALSYGAGALIEQEHDTRAALDEGLFRDLLQRRKEGTLTEAEEFLFAKLKEAWRRAAEEKEEESGTSFIEEIPSLVKWGIVGGIAFGVINITLRILELKKGR